MAAIVGLPFFCPPHVDNPIDFRFDMIQKGIRDTSISHGPPFPKGPPMAAEFSDIGLRQEYLAAEFNRRSPIAMRAKGRRWTTVSTVRTAETRCGNTNGSPQPTDRVALCARQGTRSDDGRRWSERIWIVIQTCDVTVYA
jgi:hypothetical protein